MGLYPASLGELVEPLLINISYNYPRVKRGVASSQPRKYNLDEKELARVSALARIELEDARTELMRAHAAAQSMGQDPELDNVEDDDSESGWVE